MDGRMLLKFVLKKILGCILEPVADSCVHDNEHSVSIESGEFLDQLLDRDISWSLRFVDLITWPLSWGATLTSFSAEF